MQNQHSADGQITQERGRNVSWHGLCTRQGDILGLKKSTLHMPPLYTFWRHDYKYQPWVRLKSTLELSVMVVIMEVLGRTLFTLELHPLPTVFTTYYFWNKNKSKRKEKHLSTRYFKSCGRIILLLLRVSTGILGKPWLVWGTDSFPLIVHDVVFL